MQRQDPADRLGYRARRQGRARERADPLAAAVFRQRPAGKLPQPPLARKVVLRLVERQDLDAGHVAGGADKDQNRLGEGAGKRSEERRVGEEGRSRGWPDYLKKKKEKERV